MKRDHITTVALDTDVGEFLERAKTYTRLSGSEILNRCMLAWITGTDIRRVLPPLPFPVPNLIAARVKDLRTTETKITKGTV